jgi:hypothetical protein
MDRSVSVAGLSQLFSTQAATEILATWWAKRETMNHRRNDFLFVLML